LRKAVDIPNSAFSQLRKKKVGANRYNISIKKIVKMGKKSKKKLKKRNSAIKKIDPGNPKNTSRFSSVTKNSLGHKKLIPLISVINLVLNRRFTASTKKKEFVDRRAWLINIQKVANIRGVCPLITQRVNQCISTTVE